MAMSSCRQGMPKIGFGSTRKAAVCLVVLAAAQAGGQDVLRVGAYRVFVPRADGTTLYGAWMAPGASVAGERRGALPEIVYDQTAGLFGGDVCDPAPSATEQPYPYVWTSWYNDIEVAPEDAGRYVDGAEFAYEPSAIPPGFSGPYSPSAFEPTPGQHAGCHQTLWNLSFWETIDEGVDTNGDGVSDVFNAYPVFDEMGTPTGDVTPVPNFSADLDGDGTPDVGDPAAYADQDSDGVNDSFLGGFQLFLVGGFDPGDTDGDGTPNTPLDYICPDIDGSGDPFNDFFNPIVGGGSAILGNYASSPNGPDLSTGFTTGIDAGLGLAFDVDGDGTPDIPRLPADGRGAIQFEALNVLDDDLDGIFDRIDGQALIGQPVVAGVSAFVPTSPELPGFSSGLLYVEGEDRLGGGAIPSVGGGLPADGAFTPGSPEIRVASADPGECQQIREPAIQVYAGDIERLCADQNWDGIVSPTDFGAWLANFNAGEDLADVNQDGEVTPTDFGAWLSAFNQGADGPLCD